MLDQNEDKIANIMIERPHYQERELNAEEKAALNQQQLLEQDAINDDVQSDADTEKQGPNVDRVDEETATEAAVKSNNYGQSSQLAAATPSASNAQTKMANIMHRAISEEPIEAMHTRSEPRIIDAEPDLQPQFANTGKLSMDFAPEMTQESLE